MSIEERLNSIEKRLSELEKRVFVKEEDICSKCRNPLEGQLWYYTDQRKKICDQCLDKLVDRRDKNEVDESEKRRSGIHIENIKERTQESQT